MSQKSVLTVTLFVLRVTNIVTQIQSNGRFHGFLYVNDLHVGYYHTDLYIVQQHLQGGITETYNWATKNGMKFSASKTKGAHFSLYKRFFSIISLSLVTNLICIICRCYKIGDMHWDGKLTFRSNRNHIRSR